MLVVGNDEVIKKAEQMLTDMAMMADGDPSSLSHSAFVATMWEAFNKGRKYGKFIAMADETGGT